MASLAGYDFFPGKVSRLLPFVISLVRGIGLFSFRTPIMQGASGGSARRRPLPGGPVALPALFPWGGKGAGAQYEARKGAVFKGTRNVVLLS